MTKPTIPPKLSVAKVSGLGGKLHRIALEWGYDKNTEDGLAEADAELIR